MRATGLSGTKSLAKALNSSVGGPDLTLSSWMITVFSPTQARSVLYANTHVRT